MTLYTPVPNVIYIYNIYFVCYLGCMDDNVVLVGQNVVLKTPFAAGTTTKAVLSALSGFYMSVRRRFFF